MTLVGTVSQEDFRVRVWLQYRFRWSQYRLENHDKGQKILVWDGFVEGERLLDKRYQCVFPMNNFVCKIYLDKNIENSYALSGS